MPLTKLLTSLAELLSQPETLSIPVAQPVGLNQMRCGMLTFPPDIENLICQERQYQLKVTQTQLYVWLQRAEALLNQPVALSLGKEVQDLIENIKDLQKFLFTNQSLENPCQDDLQAINAGALPISDKLAYLEGFNKNLLRHPTTTNDTKQKPISQKIKKQLSFKLSQIQEWQRILLELQEGPINIQSALALTQFERKISYFQSKIERIQKRGTISGRQINDLNLETQKHLRDINRFQQLNRQLRERDDMLATLTPGSQLMFSCYNYINQNLENSRYNLPLNNQPNCTLNHTTKVRDDSIYSCTTIHRVPFGPDTR